MGSMRLQNMQTKNVAYFWQMEMEKQKQTSPFQHVICHDLNTLQQKKNIPCSLYLTLSNYRVGCVQ